MSLYCIITSPDLYVCFRGSLIFLTKNTLIFLSDHISTLNSGTDGNLNYSYFLEIKLSVEFSNISENDYELQK